MTDTPDSIHIVGLYKCGTTWLLRILAAHPQVVAWREFDPVRAARAPDHGPAALPMLAHDYLRRRPTDAWLARREAGHWRSRDDTFRDLFLGRGWIPLMGARAQDAAEALPRADAARLLDELLELAGARARPGNAPLLEGADHDDTLGFRHHRRDELLQLLAAVRDADDTSRVPGLVYDGIAAQVAPGVRAAFKAADQLMQLSALRAAVPGARCIAVIRDGRDAAVSARHFEALMRRRGAPFRVARTGALRRLLGWSVRAAKLAAHARKGEVVVLRYEDLQGEFRETCRSLLDRLCLASDDAILAKLEAHTAFSTQSGGRPAGEDAEEVLRKGVVGDWLTALDAPTQAAAWRLAGPELRAWGYGVDGQIRPSSLVLGGSD